MKFAEEGYASAPKEEVPEDMTIWCVGVCVSLCRSVCLYACMCVCCVWCQGAPSEEAFVTFAEEGYASAPKEEVPEDMTIWCAGVCVSLCGSVCLYACMCVCCVWCQGAPSEEAFVTFAEEGYASAPKEEVPEDVTIWCVCVCVCVCVSPHLVCECMCASLSLCLCVCVYV